MKETTYNRHEPSLERKHRIRMQLLQQYPENIDAQYELNKFAKAKGTVIKSQISISADRMFLGYETEECNPDEIVTIPMPITEIEGGQIVYKPKTFLFMAAAGGGKSVECSRYVLDNIVRNFDFPTVVLDPSRVSEWWYHRYSITSQEPDSPNISEDVVPRLIADLKEVGQQPTGYSNVGYQAAFDAKKYEEKGVERIYGITLSDARYAENVVGKGTGVDMVAKILEVQQGRNMRKNLTKILLNEKLTKFSDALAEEKMPGSTILDEYDDSEEGKKFSGTLLDYLETALDNGALSDATEQKYNILQDMIDYKYVVIRGKLRTAKDDTDANAKSTEVIKFHLSKILSDRERYINAVQSESEQAYLKTPIINVVLEEADNFAPNGGQSNLGKMTENLASKDRKTGVNTFIITQFPWMTSADLVGQLNFISGVRITKPGEKNFLMSNGVPENLIDDTLSILPMDARNRYNFKIPQRFTWDKEKKEMTYYYSGMPLSGFVHT